VCIKKKRLVKMVAKKVFTQITLKLEKLTLSTQGYNKHLHVKKSHFIVSIFLHTYRMCLTCFKTIHDEILFL